MNRLRLGKLTGSSRCRAAHRSCGALATAVPERVQMYSVASVLSAQMALVCWALGLFSRCASSTITAFQAISLSSFGWTWHRVGELAGTEGSRLLSHRWQRFRRMDP